MKKLIVFGPTGRTGLAVLERAHNDPNLQVTAYLRKPEKVSDKVKNNITIILGNILDAEDVANAIKGQDIVVSCLGVGFNLGSTTVISNGLQNIVDGMRKHGLKRIIVVGVSFLMPHEITPFPLQRVGADHKRAHEILKKSKDLEWICTAPPEIVNLPYTGTCKAAINKLHGYVVTTHDLASWMLDCVKDDKISQEYAHQLVGLSSTLGLFTWLTSTTTGIFTLILSLAGVAGVTFILF